MRLRDLVWMPSVQPDTEYAQVFLDNGYVTVTRIEGRMFHVSGRPYGLSPERVNYYNLDALEAQALLFTLFRRASPGSAPD